MPGLLHLGRNSRLWSPNRTMCRPQTGRQHSGCTYIHAVCILCIHKHNKRLYRNHKTNPLVTQCVMTLHKTSRMYIHFENQLLRTTAVQQRQHVGAAGCRAFFSGLIGIFVFDVLQIPCTPIQICNEGSAPTCTPRGYGPGHRVEQHVLDINLLLLSRFD